VEVDHVYRNQDKQRFFARCMEQRPSRWPEASPPAERGLGHSRPTSDQHRKRDLAMFNLAIDSKLRGCDLVSVRVDDIASGGHLRDRATIVRHKTGRPVQFEITEQSRASLQDWLNVRPASGRLRLPEPHPRSAPCDGSPICSHRACLDRRPLPASPPTTAFVLLRLEDGGWDHASSGETADDYSR
jgi:integrase